MEVGSQFLNCSDLPPVSRLKVVNLTNSVFSILCLIVMLLLISVLVLYKGYKTTLQRLLLYVTISTALSELDTFSSVILLQFDVSPTFCMIIGFWDSWNSNMIEFFSCGLTTCLIITTIKQLRGSPFQFLRSRTWCKVAMEVIYTVTVIFIPVSYLWVPFKDKMYGLGETICVMRAYDEHCNPLNHSGVDSLSLQSVWLFLDILVIASFLVLAVLFSLWIIKLKRSSGTLIDFSTMKRTTALLLILIVSLVVRIAEFVVNICIKFLNVPVNHIFYDALDNPAYTLSNLIIPIGFAVYLYSPSKLKPKSLRQAVKRWKCCQCRSTHYDDLNSCDDAHTIMDDGKASVESSKVVDAPSHTTFDNSIYTNEFTDVTRLSDPTKNTGASYGSIQ